MSVKIFLRLILTASSFQMKNFLRSFLFAFSGIKTMFQSERNFKIQVGVFLIVVFAGFIFKLSTSEWIQLLLISGFILALEMINSVVEKLCDFIEPKQNPSIKTIKDVAAGFVLLASIFAALIGLLIFVPKIWAYFS